MIDNNGDFFILHGEDDICDVRVMSILLEKIGYTGKYHQIATGHELLDWVKANQEENIPGLIILDIGLPGMDGKELLKAFRANDQTKAIPIIIMSGSSSRRDFEECIALGGNAYIQKTSDLEKLAALLECFVDGWIRSSEQKFF